MVKASASMTLVRVNDGEDGQGIRSITPEYYLSDSATEMPDENSDGWKAFPMTTLTSIITGLGQKYYGMMEHIQRPPQCLQMT